MTDESLPDAELEVLACLWQHGEMTARQIRETMSYRPMTHSAVSALLSRLVQKGFVSRRKGPVGKSLLFCAVERPKPTYQRIVGDLLERVFGGDPLAVVSSLFEARRPTPKEIDQLQELVQQLRDQGPKSRTKK